MYQKIILIDLNSYNEFMGNHYKKYPNSNLSKDYIDKEKHNYVNLISLTLNSYLFVQLFSKKQRLMIHVSVNMLGIDITIALLKKLIQDNSNNLFLDLYDEVRYLLFALRLKVSNDYFLEKRLQRQFRDDLKLLELSYNEVENEGIDFLTNYNE